MTTNTVIIFKFDFLRIIKINIPSEHFENHKLITLQ